jgi:tripartite-type tricarboxylate transporter receptor subunit TctC
VSAQSWPQKPVKVLIPFPPGGATDIIGRIISQKLETGAVAHH